MTNVVNIGDHRYTRKRNGWLSKDVCRHINKTMDSNGDIITCDDCGMQLSAIWVLNQLIDYYDGEVSKVTVRENHLREQTNKALHLLAAKKVEAVWRSRNMVPACPHCSRGILPEDGLGGSQIGRKLELARRRADLARSP